MSEPFFSVIMPVKGLSPYFAEAIGSVAAGPEILVQVNPERDCPPIMESIGRVSVAINPTGLGCYGSINAALKRARGQFVHVLHDDDFLAPNFYEWMRALCEELPANYGAVSCAYTNVVMAPDGVIEQVPFWMQGRPAGDISDYLRRMFTITNPLTVPAVVFRRSVFDVVGPFRTDMPYAGDWEFQARLLTKFYWWYTPENLARYRIHTGQRAHAMIQDGRAERDCVLARELATEYCQHREVVRA